MDMSTVASAPQGGPADQKIDQKELLREVFKETNQHLRNTETKSLTITGAYLALFTSFVANQSFWGSSNSRSKLYHVAVLFLCALVFVLQQWYRKWKVHYMQVCQRFIQHLSCDRELLPHWMAPKGVLDTATDAVTLEQGACGSVLKSLAQAEAALDDARKAAKGDNARQILKQLRRARDEIMGAEASLRGRQGKGIYQWFARRFAPHVDALLQAVTLLTVVVVGSSLGACVSDKATFRLFVGLGGAIPAGILATFWFLSADWTVGKA